MVIVSSLSTGTISSRSIRFLSICSRMAFRWSLNAISVSMRYLVPPIARMLLKCSFLPGYQFLLAGFTSSLSAGILFLVIRLVPSTSLLSGLHVSCHLSLGFDIYLFKFTKFNIFEADLPDVLRSSNNRGHSHLAINQPLFAGNFYVLQIDVWLSGTNRMC